MGRIGLLEREAAAILNAALRPLASRVIPAIQQALKDSGIRAQLQLTSNDGTLIPADMAQKVRHHASLPLPELSLRCTIRGDHEPYHKAVTFASSPTHSLCVSSCQG